MEWEDNAKAKLAAKDAEIARLKAEITAHRVSQSLAGKDCALLAQNEALKAAGKN